MDSVRIWCSDFAKIENEKKGVLITVRYIIQYIQHQ